MGASSTRSTSRTLPPGYGWSMPHPSSGPAADASWDMSALVIPTGIESLRRLGLHIVCVG